jgi:hypothetical protein
MFLTLYSGRVDCLCKNHSLLLGGFWTAKGGEVAGDAGDLGALLGQSVTLIDLNMLIWPGSEVWKTGVQTPQSV